MLKSGIALLAASAGFLVLLVAGPFLGFAHFGPCGPDLAGFALFGGFVLAVISGMIFTLIAFLRRAVLRLSNRGGPKSA